MSTPTAALTRKIDRRPELRDRIRLDYQYLPGLALTLAQGRRLWSLEASTCRQLLDDLVADGFLRIAEDSRYRRVMA